MSEPLHVGVDAACWQNTRGYGRYARALLTAMVRRDDGLRFTLVQDAQIAAPFPPGVAVRDVRVTRTAASAAAASGSRSLGDMYRMSKALSDSCFDAVLFPSVYTYVPVLTRARKIVVVHDVIAETYPELTVPSLTARMFWKAKVSAGIRQANALVTVSDYSKQGIVRVFGAKPERVHVVSEASDPVFRKLGEAPLSQMLREKGVPEWGRLIAYVGGFGPHKNVAGLIQAFSQVARDAGLGDARLILVGEYRKEVFHSEARKILDQIASLGLEGKVLFTGFLPDEEVVTLLNRAAVLVLPSLMEGFGLPAVEAAACGCPVIATVESPLPGILEDGGIYIDPHRPEELVQALRTVLTSAELREKMGRAGLEAAARCSWDEAARTMNAIIRRSAQ